MTYKNKDLYNKYVLSQGGKEGSTYAPHNKSVNISDNYSIFTRKRYILAKTKRLGIGVPSLLF